MKMPAPTRTRSTHAIFSNANRLTRLGALVAFVVIFVITFAAGPSVAGTVSHAFLSKAVALVTGTSAGNGPSAAREAHVDSAWSKGPEAVTPLVPDSTMITERRGHTATSLADGRVLIAGGENASGQLSDSEIFDPASGTFSSSGSMTAARADHAAVKLADGRVLITGGRNGSGKLGTSEIFDPATGTFTSGPSMNIARAGHSATLFANGRVFLAGGDTGGSTEIYDPAANSFSSGGGSLGTARSMHSAALMLDGRILIAGGRNSSGIALGTVEIFDTAGGSFSMVDGNLTVARVRPHVRVLFDGKVQIIGGSNDGSMEIYDPLVETIGAYAHVLPESDPCSGLINQILSSQTRAALFYAGSTDVSRDRSGHTITELNGSNQALVLGGANGSGAFLNSSSLLGSSSALITTDKLDYAPGETVFIAGRGFQPGETVRLKIHEDPHTPQERGFDATADSNGSFTGEYLVQNYDLSMKFIVGARGLTSGFTAQTTFTDGGYFVSTSTGSTVTVSTIKYPASVGTTACPAPPPAAPPALSVTGSLNLTSAIPGQNFDMGNNRLGLLIVPVVSNEGGTYQSINATGSEGTVLSNNLSSDGAARHICVRSNNGSATNLGTLIINYAAATVATTTAVNNASTTYGDSSVVLQATVTPTTGAVNTGTVTFTVKQGLTTIGAATTSGTVSGGNASVNYALPGGTNAGSYSIEATYNAGAGFNNSTDPSPGTLTIDKASPTVTVTFAASPITYDGNPHPASVMVTGVSGLLAIPADGTTAITYTKNAAPFAGTPTDAGSYTASATFTSANSNYNNAASTVDALLTIDKATPTVSVTFAASPITYDGNPHPASVTVTGVSGLLSIPADGTTAITYTKNAAPFAGTPTDAGSYTASATFTSSNGNYNNAASTVDALLTIDKATPTVSVTFAASPITYDGNPHPASVTVTGVSGLLAIPADGTTAITYTKNAAPFAGTPTDAGSYTASATFTSANSNYNNAASTVDALLTIDKKSLTVTPDPQTIMYGAADPTFTFTYTGFVLAEGTANLTTQATCSVPGPSPHSAAGSPYVISCTAGTANNYSFNVAATAVFTVNKAPLTITASSHTITFNDPAPTITPIYSGFVLGDDGSDLTTPPTCSTTYTQGSLVGTYPTKCENAASGNYTFTYVDGTVTVLTACSVFNGFLSPIGGSVENGNGGSFASPVRSFKLNSTIPVKFNAMCFGVPLVTGIQTLQAIKYSNAMTFGDPIDATPTDAATTGNQFRLTGTEWHFNLSTKGFGNNGQGIWLFKATLFDGSTHSVWVEIKK